MIKKIVVIFALLLASSCGDKKPEKEPKPLVWVSIAPYQQLAQRIAGPTIEVQTIVPQGANPHSFEPTSKQAAEMRLGRVWFRIGEPNPQSRSCRIGFTKERRFDRRRRAPLLPLQHGPPRPSYLDEPQRHANASARNGRFAPKNISRSKRRH